MKLPKRFAPYVYGAVQSLMTTGIASAVAVGRSADNAASVHGFLSAWIPSWSLAWIVMLPIVIGAAPLIQRAVTSCVQTDI